MDVQDRVSSASQEHRIDMRLVPLSLFFGLSIRLWFGVTGIQDHMSV